MALFGFGRPRPDDGSRKTIADWARAAGRFEAATVITVNEIDCSDPACPGCETVILVMEPGKRTQARKIPKPIVQTGEDDVIHAFSA